MRHAPDSLTQLLASMGLTLHALSLQTGIPVARLRSIYHDGNPTPHELLRLTTALKASLATTFLHAAQTGRINQAGTANTQHVTINIIHIYPSSDPADAEARTWTTAEEPRAQYQLLAAG